MRNYLKIKFYIFFISTLLSYNLVNGLNCIDILSRDSLNKHLNAQFIMSIEHINITLVLERMIELYNALTSSKRVSFAGQSEGGKFDFNVQNLTGRTKDQLHKFLFATEDQLNTTRNNIIDKLLQDRTLNLTTLSLYLEEKIAELKRSVASRRLDGFTDLQQTPYLYLLKDLGRKSPRIPIMTRLIKKLQNRTRQPKTYLEKMARDGAIDAYLPEQYSVSKIFLEISELSLIRSILNLLTTNHVEKKTLARGAIQKPTLNKSELTRILNINFHLYRLSQLNQLLLNTIRFGNYLSQGYNKEETAIFEFLKIQDLEKLDLNNISIHEHSRFQIRIIQENITGLHFTILKNLREAIKNNQLNRIKEEIVLQQIFDNIPHTKILHYLGAKKLYHDIAEESLTNLSHYLRGYIPLISLLTSKKFDTITNKNDDNESNENINLLREIQFQVLFQHLGNKKGPRTRWLGQTFKNTFFDAIIKIPFSQQLHILKVKTAKDLIMLLGVDLSIKAFGLDIVLNNFGNDVDKMIREVGTHILTNYENGNLSKEEIYLIKSKFPSFNSMNYIAKQELLALAYILEPKNFHTLILKYQGSIYHFILKYTLENILTFVELKTILSYIFLFDSTFQKNEKEKKNSVICHLIESLVTLEILSKESIVYSKKEGELLKISKSKKDPKELRKALLRMILHYYKDNPNYNFFIEENGDNTFYIPYYYIIEHLDLNTIFSLVYTPLKKYTFNNDTTEMIRQILNIRNLESTTYKTILNQQYGLTLNEKKTMTNDFEKYEDSLKNE